MIPQAINPTSADVVSVTSGPHPYTEFRSDLKTRALEIRRVKNERNKEYAAGRSVLGGENDSRLHILKYEYRARHLALCFARGRTFEECETHKEDYDAKHILAYAWKFAKPLKADVSEHEKQWRAGHPDRVKRATTETVDA